MDEECAIRKWNTSIDLGVRTHLLHSFICLYICIYIYKFIYIKFGFCQAVAACIVVGE